MSEVQVLCGTDADQPATRFTTARFKEYRLVGRMAGNLGVDEDTGPYPYDSYVELYMRGGVLEGTVTRTVSLSTSGG